METNTQPNSPKDLFTPKVLWTIIGILLFVVVTGSVAWYKTLKETPKADQHTTTNPTTTWKTYTNTQYGYEFKYPADTYVLNPFGGSSKSNVVLYEKSQVNETEPYPNLGVSVYANPQAQNPETWLKANYQKFLGTPSEYSDFSENSATVFNGMEAVKFGNERDHSILVTNNTSAYVITYIPSPRSETDQQILSTFKFTK